MSNQGISIRAVIAASTVGAATLAFVAQMAIDFSSENIACACLVLGSFLSVFLYLNWTHALETHPLSSFAIFGFCVTTQLGALLAQSVAWTALTTSLYQPVYTFATLAFYQTIAIAAHAIYRLFSTSNHAAPSLLRKCFEKAGLYVTPSSGALWIMGAIGVVGLYFSHGEGVFSKVCNAFRFFTWAPFLIPLYLQLHGADYCSSRRTNFLLIAYALVVVMLGLAANVRAIMFTGVITVALAYLLMGMRSTSKITSSAVARIGMLAVVALAAIGPLSNLAVAMVVAREARGKISAGEMIENTLDIWSRPGLMQKYKAEMKASAVYGAYDENYIENPILARFVETKFHDNALYFGGTLTTDDSKARLRETTINFLWYSVPSPVLGALGINVNKKQFEFSMGDYLVYLSRGIPLGGYKTGSVFAQGRVLFGAMFPLIYGSACVILFALMDLLTKRSTDGVALVSTLALMNIWQFFLYGITADSLHYLFIHVVRGFPQTVATYLLVLGLVRWSGRGMVSVGLRQS